MLNLWVDNILALDLNPAAAALVGDLYRQARQEAGRLDAPISLVRMYDHTAGDETGRDIEVSVSTSRTIGITAQPADLRRKAAPPVRDGALRGALAVEFGTPTGGGPALARFCSGRAHLPG